jgi:hypothetical protein
MYEGKDAEPPKSVSTLSPRTSSSINSEIKDEAVYDFRNSEPDYSLETLLRSPIPRHVGLKWRGAMRFSERPLYGKNEDGHPHWSVTTNIAAYPNFMGHRGNAIFHMRRDLGVQFFTHREGKYLIIWVEDQRQGNYIDKQTKCKLDRAWHFLYLWVWAKECRRLPRDVEDFLVDFLRLDIKNKLGKIPAQPSRPSSRLFKTSALDLSQASANSSPPLRSGSISSRDSRQHSDMGGYHDQSRSKPPTSASRIQDIQQSSVQDDLFDQVAPRTRHHSQPRDMLTQTKSFIRKTESETLCFRGRPR